MSDKLFESGILLSILNYLYVFCFNLGDPLSKTAKRRVSFYSPFLIRPINTQIFNHYRLYAYVDALCAVDVGSFFWIYHKKRLS